MKYIIAIFCLGCFFGPFIYIFYLPLFRFLRRRVYRALEQKRTTLYQCHFTHRPFHQSIRFHLYIITHDENSFSIAKEWSKCIGWATILNISSTKYFESIAYVSELAKYRHAWRHLNFVGLCTYRSLSVIPFERLKAFLELGYYRGYDVVPFMNGGKRLLSQGMDHHTAQFKPIWTKFLSSLGFHSNQIFHSDFIEVVYRNTFLIRPHVLDKLTRFMRRSIIKVERNDTLKTLLSTNSHYREVKEAVAYKVFGQSYYEWFPFLFERLPCFYLSTNNYSVFSTLHEIESFANPSTPTVKGTSQTCLDCKSFLEEKIFSHIPGL